MHKLNYAGKGGGQAWVFHDFESGLQNIDWERTKNC